MTAPISTVTVSVPPPDERELRRYAGCKTGLAEQIAAVLREGDGFVYRVCYGEFNLSRCGNDLDLGFSTVQSADLRAALAGAEKILLFAATVGPFADRMIARYKERSPATALLWQAFGTERVEALCNAFCREKSAEYAAAGKALLPRFSPGYGDLPLALQRDIFAVLNCPVRLGIILNNSLLMTPTKSVTAIAGIR